LRHATVHGADKTAPAGRVALSIASSAEASRGAALMAMLQDGFSRRRNGQDVNWLNANKAEGGRTSGRGGEGGRGVSSARAVAGGSDGRALGDGASDGGAVQEARARGSVGGPVGLRKGSCAVLDRARGGSAGDHVDDERVAMGMLQEGMPSSWNAGGWRKGGGGGAPAGLLTGAGARGVSGLIMNGSTDAASLEAELQARIVVLAESGVDTSNDEELARALQAMLDREYEEELSLRLCQQLEQEEQDRVVAMRLEREAGLSGHPSLGNANGRFGALRLGGPEAEVPSRRPCQVEQDRLMAMRMEEEEEAWLQHAAASRHG